MSIFSKIAAGEIPSYKCAESEKFYAFLDINPLAKGHTLVIPREEVDYIFDLDDATLAEMHVFAKHVATAHIHLIPIREEGDMDFRKPKLQLPAEEMQALAEQIYAAFQQQ